MKTAVMSVDGVKFYCVGSDEKIEMLQDGVLSEHSSGAIQILSDIIYSGVYAYSKTENEKDRKNYDRALHRAGLLVNEDIYQLALFYKNPEKQFVLPGTNDFTERKRSFEAIFQ